MNKTIQMCANFACFRGSDRSARLCWSVVNQETPAQMLDATLEKLE